MKFRLTPLNIITSLGIAFLAISFFEARPAGGLANINMGTFYKVILSSLILVSIVTDLIFRFIFKDLKKIWFIELFFIAFTIILFLILQK
jgi:hypothetical protein